jgi:hypothetical protein
METKVKMVLVAREKKMNKDNTKEYFFARFSTEDGQIVKFLVPEKEREMMEKLALYKEYDVALKFAVYQEELQTRFAGIWAGGKS